MTNSSNPTLIVDNYKIIDQNILGSGLNIGPGPYIDINFTENEIDLTQQNISATDFQNCTIGPILHANRPILNTNSQYFLETYHNNQPSLFCLWREF